MREQFREIRFNERSRARISQCNEIIREYLAQDLRLTLRQLYYQLVARGLLGNTVQNYKALGSLVSDARLAGLIDWSAIEDRGRQPRTVSDWPNVQSLVESALKAYRLPRWKGQQHYVELWVEKDALAGVLEPLARQFHATLMVNRGYSSQSAMYESARRFIESCQLTRSELDAHEKDGAPLPRVVADARYEGALAELVRSPVLLYIGDHDPSGEDMVRDIRARLSLFGVDVQVEKIALTTAQVREYDPPENPVKLTDARAPRYIEQHGRHCWEVDALPPDVLSQIVKRAFRRFIDRPKMDAIKEQEKVDKKRLRDAAANLAYPDIDGGPPAPPTERNE